MSDQERGLYSKFHVARRDDPTGKHAECEYYVLDLVHDRHAAPALLAYADSCASLFPQLAEDLRAEASEIPNAAPFLVDPESEAANPVWDLVVETCQQAWPEKLLSWNTSPTELIVDLINERDRALEQLQLNAAPREGASSPAGPAQNGEPAGAAPSKKERVGTYIKNAERAAVLLVVDGEPTLLQPGSELHISHEFMPAPAMGEWQPMHTAPLDGTEVEILFRHHTYWTALKVNGREEAEELWQAVQRAKWIDHNGGGWTWHGMAGTPMGWRPLP